MRIILFVAMFFSCMAVKSQTVVPFGIPAYSQGMGLVNNIPAHDSLSKRKWFFSTYSGLSTSISFFNQGNATIFAAPMGIQLNRRLSNNFYAFGSVAVIPAFISLNPSFISKGTNKNYQGNTFMSNNFNVYPSVSLGAMYINDARTFSISGSISAERSSYPLLPYYPSNNGQNPVIHPAR